MVARDVIKRFDLKIVLKIETLMEKNHHVHEQNNYYSPSIIKMMKSRKLRWAGHVAGIAEERKVWESQMQRDH
jgi:hypothetical protein